MATQRNTIHTADTPISQMGENGLENVLDRGHLPDWQRVWEAIYNDPFADFVDLLWDLADRLVTPGLGTLVRLMIQDARGLEIGVDNIPLVEMWP